MEYLIKSKVKKKCRKCIFALGLFFLLIHNTSAQNFNYSLVKDSATCSPLNNQVVLLGNEDFLNKHPSVHLPFHFNFCGSSTDSVIIETNGFVVFDKLKTLSLVSFNNFSSKRDSLRNYVSSINYSVEGAPPNQIFKLEFKNLSLNEFSYYDNLSYQIWLYENGNIIEYHIGNSYYSTLSDWTMPVLLGTINQSMNTDQKAFLISGDPSAPTGQLISGESGLENLNNIPHEGIIYRLIPSF